MRLGLVGWGVASGNGGMNTDIACLSNFVTKWLIPQHPKFINHDSYLNKATEHVEITFVKPGDNYDEIIDSFCENIDGLLYIEHPIFNLNEYKYDVVQKFHEKGKKVFAIPMWEWWPEETSWAVNTDAIWAVTAYTNKYMHALADVLESRGIQPVWKDSIFGSQWGINVNDFSYRQRDNANEIVFVRGNAGYKDRKAGNLIIPELTKLASESEFKVTIYSQADLPNTSNLPPNVQVTQKVFPDRKSVYENGDIFIFCSHWEGLCHGIYEASYSGGLVLTTNTEPMDECKPAFLVDVENISTEKLAKNIKKVTPSMKNMRNILDSLQGKNISHLSHEAHEWVASERDLSVTLSDMYAHFVQCF